MKRLMIVLLLILIAGCRPAPTPATTPSLSPSPPPPTPAPPPSPEADDAPLHLRLWVSDAILPAEATEAEAPLLAQIAAFDSRQEHIEIEVLVKKNAGTGGLLDLLETASQAAPAVLPDLVLMDESAMREAAAEKLLQPLPAESLPPSSYETAVAASRIESETFGLPYLVAIEGLALRPTPALTLPEGTLYWHDVISEALPLLFPAAPPDDLADDFLLRLYLEAGGSLQDEAGNLTLDRDALEQSYGFIAEAVQAGLIDPQTVLALPDAQSCWTTFREEERWRLTVLPAADYWLASPQEAVPVEALLPTTTTKPLQIGHYWLWALVTTDERRQEAALTLLDWLLTPPNLSDVSEAVHLFPTTGEALALWPLPPAEFTFVSRLVTAAAPPPPQPVEGNVRKALQSGLTLLLNHPQEVTPAEAAEHALLTLRK